MIIAHLSSCHLSRQQSVSFFFLEEGGGGEGIMFLIDGNILIVAELIETYISFSKFGIYNILLAQHN